jgi:polar amino acid transport system substrate-binding protein
MTRQAAALPPILTRAAVVLGALLAALGLAFWQTGASRAADQKSLLQEIRDKGELRVGFAVADPHQFKDPTTGEWKGIAYDMMADWAQVMGVRLVPVDTSWDAMIEGLQAGNYDIASALNRRPPRALVVTYSESYLPDRGVFTVDLNRSQAHTWADINQPGQTICVVQGTAEDKSLTAIGTSATLLRLGDQNECRLALQSGNATAFFDDISGQAKYANENSWARLIVPDPPLQLEGVGFAIRKGYSYDDIQALDIEVENWVNNGLLLAAESKYGLPNWEPFTHR